MATEQTTPAAAVAEEQGWQWCKGLKTTEDAGAPGDHVYVCKFLAPHGWGSAAEKPVIGFRLCGTMERREVLPYTTYLNCVATDEAPYSAAVSIIDISKPDSTPTISFHVLPPMEVKELKTSPELMALYGAWRDTDGAQPAAEEAEAAGAGAAGVGESKEDDEEKAEEAETMAERTVVVAEDGATHEATAALTKEQVEKLEAEAAARPWRSGKYDPDAVVVDGPQPEDYPEALRIPGCNFMVVVDAGYPEWNAGATARGPAIAVLGMREADGTTVSSWATVEGASNAAKWMIPYVSRVACVKQTYVVPAYKLLPFPLVPAADVAPDFEEKLCEATRAHLRGMEATYAHKREVLAAKQAKALQDFDEQRHKDLHDALEAKRQARLPGAARPAQDADLEVLLRLKAAAEESKAAEQQAPARAVA